MENNVNALQSKYHILHANYNNTLIIEINSIFMFCHYLVIGSIKRRTERNIKNFIYIRFEIWLNKTCFVILYIVYATGYDQSICKITIISVLLPQIFKYKLNLS